MNEDCREDLRRMKKKTQRATEVQFVYEIYLCDVCACWEIGADGDAHLTLSTINVRQVCSYRLRIKSRLKPKIGIQAKNTHT